MPESALVAGFGGTLLSETGVLAGIARCSQPRTVPDLLAQLAPEELTEAAVRIATDRHSSQRFATVEQFIAAIEQRSQWFLAVIDSASVSSMRLSRC
jgi:hypothetical protein